MKNFNENLEKYAELVIRTGINIQPKQELIISAPIESKEFVRALYKKAYQSNSGRVHVFWNDEKLSPIYYEYAPDEVIESFPEWQKETYLSLAKKGAAFLSIHASDPTLLKDSDPEKIAKSRKISSIELKDFMSYTSTGKIRWNVVSVPTDSWAKQVFSDLSVEDAVEKLWKYIFKTTRVDTDDPIHAWEEHRKNLFSKCDYLNNKKFKILKYTAPGTDLEVELPKGHIWLGGPKKAKDGHYFVPNIPTEEVFTLNKKDGVNGTLRSTMPLNFSGNLIKDISLVFKDGKVVEYDASQGKNLLEKLLEIDEGASYLGEVALVPYDSPISNLNTLFYNTLYDENASCHFAFGRAYPYTLEGGTQMTEEELVENGANFSLTHVDFMVGSNELDIDGITEDGQIIPIFRKGDWVI